ncbi:MAG: sulfurtransferase TusA family protein [Actinomycetia bacterium]|nr:sulfurtransferase TusA family protein [Actinomycetes bacterium]
MTAENGLPPADLQIDATGLLCPKPIIELGRAAQRLRSGIIELVTDDPVARHDVPAWCRMRSAELLHTETLRSGETTFLVQLGDGS